MGPLQRSSYSFRRQGSSGRIWENNRLNSPEKKDGSAVQASSSSRTDHESSGDRHNSSNVDSGRRPPRSATKAQKGTISSIFALCLKGPVTASS